MVRIKLQVTEGGEVRNVVRKWNVSSISTEDEECLLLDDLDERSDTQKKTFCRWVNHILKKAGRSQVVKDLIADLQDGTVLLALLETITGKKLDQEKGRMRVHKINNVNKALDALKTYDTKLVNIRGEEIVDGNSKLILGLIWSVIYQFQIKSAMQQMISGNESSGELEKTLLNWCRQCTQSYREVDVRNFTTSWKDGLAFNALIHYHRPHLFDYNALLGQPANDNLVHAFEKSNTDLGLSPLLDPEDVDNDQPDKKSIIMYITTMYDAFYRPSTKPELTESDGSAEDPNQAARSDSPTPSSVSTMSEWDDYNETLNQVLAWLLQAETQLKQQENISDQVDQVKEQFREHEDFMMILTSHQTSVGSVLEFGSQLINEGIVMGKEEKDIREQMAVLSDRWENLRVSAMQRQTELHQHLMKLQQLQLKDLSDWLSKAETEMAETDAIASDLDIVKQQVEKHKKFQEELENQQQHVNSLSHMVVVVDESESENATLDLENQLAILGERWSKVCKWTEHRWESLQDILISWQRYRNEEQILNNWLREKELSLKEISVIDMGDKAEVQKQIQNLKNLEVELTQQQNSFGEFNLAAQQVAQTLEDDSPAIQGIQDTMEDFNQRWNTIASMLNTKMKHLRGIETKLDTFMQEIEENVNWINDTELLLQPSSQPQKDLIESLDHAVKKRRDSIIALIAQGDQIMQQGQIAGQSVAGLQNYLQTFRQRWEKLTNVLVDHKASLEFAERKNRFIVETQRIIVVITEITKYIKRITIEYKHNPVEFLIKIDVKLKELEECKQCYAKLTSECQEINEPALKASIESELEEVFQKIDSVEKTVIEKQTEVKELAERTPPPEFTEKVERIRVIVEEVFTLASVDFKYHNVENMQEMEETLKVKLNLLQEQDELVQSLVTEQKEMLKGLSPDKGHVYHKQLTEVARQCNDCMKITENRIQRVTEAIAQTKELETAMNETFHWMDDVDKFLKEITGTIAEGDVETIESQIQEVEALQQDIVTVQKKVNSLVDTCTLIMNRSNDSYAENLKSKLSTLSQRWDSIIALTSSQKDNLRNACTKFQEIGNGVKDVAHYLNDVEKDVERDNTVLIDQEMFKTLEERYLNIEIHLSAKAVTLKEYSATVQKLIAVGGVDAETPQVCMELEQSTQMHALISAKVKALLEKIMSTKSLHEELEHLVKKQYQSVDALESVIVSVSDKLDGDLGDLQECFTRLDEFGVELNNDDARRIIEVTIVLESTSTAHIATTTTYETRVREITQRYKKVRDIVEGEISKREQLHQDIDKLNEWIIKITLVLKEQAGKTETAERDIEKLKEEISMNESLIASAEKSIASLQNTEQQRELILKLEFIQTQWKVLIEHVQTLESKPKQKELEMQFSLLEGNVLSGIDNLKRKVKKVTLKSPAIIEIQSVLSDLKDMRVECDSIQANIESFNEVANELFTVDEGGLPAINEVEREYKVVLKMLEGKEKTFNDAVPLADFIYEHLDNLAVELDLANANLQNVCLDPLPLMPKESIVTIQDLVKSVKDKTNVVQELCTNTAQLRSMSDEQPFLDLETKVQNLHHTYECVLTEGDKKIDVLNSWIDELDSYQKKVEQINSWIDSRLDTLESIGGVTAQSDVEMELQKLKGIKSLMDAKEYDLDDLKAKGDDIASKGSSSLVGPVEKQVFERWDNLERKLNHIESDLNINLKEFEKADEDMPSKEDEETLVEPQVLMEVECEPEIQCESMVTLEAGLDLSVLETVTNADVDIDMDVVEEKTTTTTTEVVVMETEEEAKVESAMETDADPKVKINVLPSPKVRITMKQQPPVKREPLQYRIDIIITTIETIEKSIEELRCTSTEDIKIVEEGVQKLEDDLQELQPHYESLLEEAKNDVADLPSDEKAPIMKLTRTFGGAQNNLAVRKHSLQGAEYKLNKLNTDIMKVQLWLQDVEKAMLEQNDQYNFEDIEEYIEINAAEMEGVNIRAEQLSFISSDSLIPRKQIASLNKKFKMVSSQFEQFQRPEERVTTYKISVQTGGHENSDTRANVYVKLFGEYGNSDQLHLRQSETKRKKFQQDQVDLFTYQNEPWLGKLSKIRVWHDNDGANPEWYLSTIYVLDELSGRLFCFVFDSWLSKESGAVLKEMGVSAMGLSKEASTDVLIKKHKVYEIQWLFETINTTVHEPKLKVEFFVEDIKHVIETIHGIQLMFKHPCFLGKPYDNLEQQHKVLKDVARAIEELNPTLTKYMLLRNRYLDESTPEEMHLIDISLTNMRSKWNAINKDYKAKYFTYEANSNVWKQFHDYMEALSVFLTNAEGQGSSEDEAKMLRENLHDHDEKLKKANEIAAEICSQSSHEESSMINEKMATLNVRWTQIKRSIDEPSEPVEPIDVDEVQSKLNDLESTLDELNDKLENKPHPLQEDDLSDYIVALQDCETCLPTVEEQIGHLANDVATLLAQQHDLTPTQKEELKVRFETIQSRSKIVCLSIGERKMAAEEKLRRATNFLEELEELSMWMSATRELLEGQKAGKLGYNVDPETIKLALDTRKSNVEAINNLLTEIKGEDELTDGQFPADVGEKVLRLNTDWQIIIELSISLKQTELREEVKEEYIITENLQMEESHEFNFLDGGSDGLRATTTGFETNVAQIHDWLKLVEQKNKNMIVVLGDDDDMESSLQKTKTIQTEMENRKPELEDVVEMGAALNMDSSDDAYKLQTEDKVTKLKEHWEIVAEKISSNIKNIEQMIVEWRRFNEGKKPLVVWLDQTMTQVKGDQKIATSIEELEDQLKKHKLLQDEILSWSTNFNNLRQLADSLEESYSLHDSTEFKTTVTEIYEHWNQLETMTSTRQVTLQNALDRLLLFHKDMTAANTWLSDTESRVAGLDSLVEACHAEDSGDMQGIKQEMNELEADISTHQQMFLRLNATSNAIMATLEEGDVRTALQSKLDDMNDRWNSLGLHMVDIRDRIDGTGEWRQLLSDMQDIKDWLERADKELKSQQPAGPYIESVQQQSDSHEEFKEKLNARKLVIEQALSNGHNFLLKNQAQTEDPSYAKQEENLVARAAANLQVQLEHVESQWLELNDNSNKWERTIHNILELANHLLEDMDYINTCLSDLERIRDSWQPVSEIDNIHIQLEEVKNLNERATNLESQFDTMDGSAKDLRHGHNVSLSKRTEGIIEKLHERWKQLLQDCQERPHNLQNIMTDLDHQTMSPLQGSVAEPWERGQSLNKVPYFINHDTQTTQWDHPKMTGLFHTLSELNCVKFAAYRTSMKLRCIQKACCLDLVELHDIITEALSRHGLQSNNEDFIDVGEMIAVLITIFENVKKARKDAINEAQCVDMTLNWLLNVYDSGRIGKIRVLSFKVGIVLMSRAKLEDKWRYLFEQIEDTEKNVDSKKLGLLLHDCVQIPRQLGEIAAFGGSNIEPSVRSCFEKVKESESNITVEDFVSWTAAEPQSVVWMPVLHRLAAAETAKHEAKCKICKECPIVGFRYRCLKCFNYDLCQNCFWSGRINKSHRVTHPMHQYSLATTTGEDMSDFVKLMKNKFKSRRYRSRPPKKLGYLPVQTIMEGSNIETPSLPVPDMNFGYGLDDSGSPVPTRFEMDDMNEEHRLIQQMCQSLNNEHTTNHLVPKSPSQILKSLDTQQKPDIDELIVGLEEEHQALLSEYNRLKGIQANAADETFYTNGSPDAGRDAELIAEAKVLRQHKGRLESRMQTLEDHNRQLEAQLQRLRQLLEQPPSERERVAMNMHTPSSSSSRVTPALTPSSSYHGTPEPERRDMLANGKANGYSSDNIDDFHHVTSQIEHAFSVED